MHGYSDVIIVGAGPAGLFAARELKLSAPHLSVGLFDAGTSVSGRACNYVKRGTCASCPVCHLVYGFGGAGMFSDGKLSMYPAGSGLLGFFADPDALSQTNQYVVDTIMSGLRDTAWEAPPGIDAPALGYGVAEEDEGIKTFNKHDDLRENECDETRSSAPANLGEFVCPRVTPMVRGMRGAAPEGGPTLSRKHEPNSDLQENVSSAFDGTNGQTLRLKHYRVLHLGTERIQRFCRQLEADLTKLGVVLVPGARLVTVCQNGSTFCCSFERTDGTVATTHSRYLLLATGKGSGRLARKVFASLRTAYRFNAIDLGVRIETSRRAMSEIAHAHRDAKIKLNVSDDIEVRTFCLCEGGFLVPCKYDGLVSGRKITTISGFSYTNRRSHNSNFGVLVRRTFPDGFDPVLVQSGIVGAINDVSATDGTVVQRLDDFLQRRPSTSEGMVGNELRTTLVGSTPTNLRWLLPEYITDAVERFITCMAGVAPRLLTDGTLVHAPVWENCFDKVVLDADLSTTTPNFFVVGDASGQARGLVQAATMGVRAAGEIARRECRASSSVVRMRTVVQGKPSSKSPEEKCHESTTN